jgi:large subunit ribosomal protein L24
MKRKFSKSWRASRQRRKQRKYIFNAPLHLRCKLLAANLSKELRKKYYCRNLQLRKGDIVRIMRGEFTDKKGKIIETDTKRIRVYVEGIQHAKKDGTKINVPLKPSKLQITELNLDDKKRLQSVESKSRGIEK